MRVVLQQQISWVLQHEILKLLNVCSFHPNFLIAEYLACDDGTDTHLDF